MNYYMTLRLTDPCSEMVAGIYYVPLSAAVWVRLPPALLYNGWRGQLAGGYAGGPESAYHSVTPASERRGRTGPAVNRRSEIGRPPPPSSGP